MKKAIGERKLILDGREYILRPSHQALMEAEDLAGAGLIEIAQAMGRGSDRVRWGVALVYACLKEALLPGERVPTLDAVAKWIYDAGYHTKVRPIVSDLLTQMLLHGETGVEKKSEATASPAT